MATTTQNLGLIKPAGTDKIRIAQINSNMDTIDAKMGPVGSTPLQTQATNAASSISALQSSMAIICNGDTHAAIASGAYAYVRNHSSLAEGLYQATTAIAANATLSISNLRSVSGGGLNSVKSALSDQIATKDISSDFTKESIIDYLQAYKTGNVIQLYMSTNLVSGSTINFGTIPSKHKIRGTGRYTAPVIEASSGLQVGNMFIIDNSGSMTAYFHTPVSNKILFTSFVYVT